MADVNPIQDLRFKEIMKRVIPASYFLVLLYSVKTILHCQCWSFVPKVGIVLATLSSNIFYSLLALVVVYVIGFCINTLASEVERFLYRCKIISRPSKKVLGKKRRLKRDDVAKIVSASKVKVPDVDAICQEQAKKILYFAKDNISRRDNIVEDFYYHSIMARNLFVAHLLFVVSLLFFQGIIEKIASNWFLFIVLTLLAICIYNEWIRKNKLYVHNVFVEYLKEHKE